MMFRTLFFLILIGFNSSYLFSQDEKDLERNKESNIKEKKHQFGFTIKRANYSYYPVESPNAMEQTGLFGGIDESNAYSSLTKTEKSSLLRNNEKIINPFSFMYYNKNLNLTFEFSHYSLILDSPYYREIFPKMAQSSTPFSFNFFNYDIGNILRSEDKLNVYSNTKLNESNSFFYGLGIRNLKKENYNRTRFSQDSIIDNTYGINLLLKYNYRIISNLSLNISLEPFYTYGARNFKRDAVDYLRNPNDFSLNYNNPHAKIYFYGGEFDINLSFNFFENLIFIFGYGFIYTKIRYENDRRLTFSNSFGRISMPSYTSSYIHSTDHINNYYVGLNAKF